MKCILICRRKDNGGLVCFHLNDERGQALREIDVDQRTVNVCARGSDPIRKHLDQFQEVGSYDYIAINTVFSHFPAGRGLNLESDCGQWLKIASHFLQQHQDNSPVRRFPQAIEDSPLAAGTRHRDSLGATEGPPNNVKPACDRTGNPVREGEEELIEIVRSEIIELLSYVVKCPLLHFSEKGLHLHLGSRLLQHSELSEPVETRIPTRYARELATQVELSRSDLPSYHRQVFSVSPLQVEYGNNLRGAYRIDQCILHPDDIAKISTPSFKTADGKYVYPLVGIEFGTEKIGLGKLPEHFANDGLKLAECKYGYSITIVRNTNFREGPGKSAQRKEAQLQEFRDALSSQMSIQPEIRWVGMIIHVTRGKLDVMNRDASWTTLETVNNDSAVRATLQALL